MKKYLSVFLVLALLSPKSSFAITPPLANEEIIGTVNGEDLPLKEFTRLINAQRKTFRQSLNYDLFSKTSSSKRKELLGKAKNDGLAVPYEDFSIAWGNLLKNYSGIGNLEKKGKENKLLLVDIQRKLEDNILLDKYFDKHIKTKLLGLMVDEAIVLSEAKQRNLKVGEEDIRNKLDLIKEKHGGDSGFIKFLATNNATVEDAKQEIKNQLLYQMVKDSVSKELQTDNKEKIKAYFNIKKRSADIDISSEKVFGKDTSLQMAEIVKTESPVQVVKKQQIIQASAPQKTKAEDLPNLSEITQKITIEVKKQLSDEMKLLQQKLEENEILVKNEKEKSDKLALELKKKEIAEKELLKRQAESESLALGLKKKELAEKELLKEKIETEMQAETQRLALELKNKEESEKQKNIEAQRLAIELKNKIEIENQRNLEREKLALELKNKQLEAEKLTLELRKKEEINKDLLHKQAEAESIVLELNKQKEIGKQFLRESQNKEHEEKIFAGKFEKEQREVRKAEKIADGKILKEQHDMQKAVKEIQRAKKLAQQTMLKEQKEMQMAEMAKAKEDKLALEKKFNEEREMKRAEKLAQDKMLKEQKEIQMAEMAKAKEDKLALEKKLNEEIEMKRVEKLAFENMLKVQKEMQMAEMAKAKEDKVAFEKKLKEERETKRAQEMAERLKLKEARIAERMKRKEIEIKSIQDSNPKIRFSYQPVGFTPVQPPISLKSLESTIPMSKSVGYVPVNNINFKVTAPMNKKIESNKPLDAITKKEPVAVVFDKKLEEKRKKDLKKKIEKYAMKKNLKNGNQLVPGEPVITERTEMVEGQQQSAHELRELRNKVEEKKISGN
jgi:hypothetical protein